MARQSQKFRAEIFAIGKRAKMSEFSIQSLTGGTCLMFQPSENSEHAQEPQD